MVRKRSKKRENLTQRFANSSLGFLACVIGTLVLGLTGECWAVTTDGAQKTDATAQQAEDKNPPNLEDILRSNFAYKRGNRPDPFLPFISEQTVSERIETEEVLSGMRLFEPGQLKLVAITTGGLSPLALVQDSTGKGYILEKGIAIGRRGIIKSIVPNAVIIEESFLSSAGQKRNRTIEMILRKEGEK